MSNICCTLEVLLEFYHQREAAGTHEKETIPLKTFSVHFFSSFSRK